MKTYKPSITPVISSAAFGFVWLGINIIWILSESVSIWWAVSMFVSIFILGYAVYYEKARRQSKGFYWDDEGVVIDLDGTKVYWYEIEKIKFFQGMYLERSTIIFPHYQYHEEIFKRQKDGTRTPAYQIEFQRMQHPKQFHEGLMNAWASYQKERELTVKR